MPDLVRFRDRLAEVLTVAEGRGRLLARDVEALLVDPDFDDEEFERFRETAQRRGIPIPDDASPPEDGAEVRAPEGEPERDLLDLYLREIGRVPLLVHEDLLALAFRSRAGDEDARRRIILANLRSLDEGSNMEAFEQLSTEDLTDAPPSVEQLVELQLETEKLDRLLRSLSQREEQILRIRYGFYDGVARTLAQTGQHFGISRERVRQIESRALDKLRRAIEMQDLDRTTGQTIQ